MCCPHLAVLKGFGQLLKRSACLGYQQQPISVSIEPVHLAKYGKASFTSVTDKKLIM